MCRICGRMIKCIFDSMPSRTAPSASRSISTAARTSNAQSRHISSKSLPQDTFNTRASSIHIPPTYLLPIQSRLHQAAVAHQAVTSPSQFQNTQAHIPPTDIQLSSPQDLMSSTTTSKEIRSLIPPTKPLVLSKSVQTLLPALHAQSPHYITAHIHRFPYLLTEGDLIRLPFHMHGVQPGDILRFNRASILGSRDFTLKAGTHHSESYDQKRTGEPNYLDERLFECRARVMGVESQPLQIKEKKKRRNRKTRTVKSKHRYTVLRVMQVKVRSLEELKDDAAAQLIME